MKHKITLTPKAAEAAALKKPRTTKTKASTDTVADAGPASEVVKESLPKAKAPSAAPAAPVMAPIVPRTSSDDRRARVDDVPDEETLEEELGEIYCLHQSDLHSPSSSTAS